MCISLACVDTRWITGLLSCIIIWSTWCLCVWRGTRSWRNVLKHRNDRSKSWRRRYVRRQTIVYTNQAFVSPIRHHRDKNNLLPVTSSASVFLSFVSSFSFSFYSSLWPSSSGPNSSWWVTQQRYLLPIMSFFSGLTFEVGTSYDCRTTWFSLGQQRTEVPMPQMA